MAEATEHFDRPGAGPYTAPIFDGPIPTGYYVNPLRGEVELVKSNPAGTPDELVATFADIEALRFWFWNERRAGRLR